MGNQLIIIGATGTFNRHLVNKLVAHLVKDGLSVRHASVRYQGETHFATGGTTDLKAEIEEAGLKLEIQEPARDSVVNDVVTLDVINDNVLEVKAILKRFESYEKKSQEKAPKAGKKGGGETLASAPSSLQLESQPAPQPQSTAPAGETPTPNPPTDDGSGPTVGDAPAATEGTEG